MIVNLVKYMMDKSNIGTYLDREMIETRQICRSR